MNPNSHTFITVCQIALDRLENGHGRFQVKHALGISHDELRQIQLELELFLLEKQNEQND